MNMFRLVMAAPILSSSAKLPIAERYSAKRSKHAQTSADQHFLVDIPCQVNYWGRIIFIKYKISS
jgi:hypothetical protein